MSMTLYVSGRRGDAGEVDSTVMLNARSLLVLFAMQAACDRVPVLVVIVENERVEILQKLRCLPLKEEMRDKQSVTNIVSCEEQITGFKQNYSDASNDTTANISQNFSNLNSSEVNSAFDIMPVCSSFIFPVTLSSFSFPISVQDCSECADMIQRTALPAVLCHDQHWCVSGPCAALRCILNAAGQPQAVRLLGFREGCLQSCSEVSCWTKFCEIEVPSALEEAFSVGTDVVGHKKILKFPAAILRYNQHLARPPILHNALKRKQQYIRKTVKDRKVREMLLSKKLCDLPDLSHDFAEGLDMTLADVMLFLCFDLIVYKMPFLSFNEHSPLVIKWLNLISADEGVVRALPLLDRIKSRSKYISLPDMSFSVHIPEVIAESLYKSDPERPKLHCTGSMTLQHDIDRILKLLSTAGVTVDYDLTDESQSIALPWDDYPTAVHPQEGQLPPSRLLRKCQQLENMVRSVIRYCQPGHTIVDFCAGGGHLGIVLAYCLPRCSVILVENKASSLEKAKARVDILGLSNVHFYQCNLDYFTGDFDVGVCLHACGQATDLVLQKCFAKGAAFVCSPCCYGSIQPNHKVQYPRSTLYCAALPRLTDYLTLSHAADQTHGPEHPSTTQGQRCMRLVDGDRLAHAAQLGYSACLRLMTPVTCSPKNHILEGTIQSKE